MPRATNAATAKQDEGTGVRQLTSSGNFRERREDEQSMDDGPQVQDKKVLTCAFLVCAQRSHALIVAI